MDHAAADPQVAQAIAARLQEAEKEELRNTAAAKTAKKLLKEIEAEVRAADKPQELLIKKISALLHQKAVLELTHSDYKQQTEGVWLSMSAKETELSKTVKVKAALENLCRELQANNIALKEENIRIQEKGRQDRQDLIDQFQHNIVELQERMQTDQEEKTKQEQSRVNLQECVQKIFADYDSATKAFKEVLDEKEQEITKLKTLLIKNMEMITSLEQELAQTQQVSLVHKLSEETTRAELEKLMKSFGEYNIVITQTQSVIANYKKELAQTKTELQTQLTRNATLDQNVLLMAEQKQLLEKKAATLGQLCRTLQSQLDSARAASVAALATVQAPTTSDPSPSSAATATATATDPTPAASSE
eukprot:m.224614 g.224614  ORF g.224614 m.224614 type:complete len:362 (-) comp54200_c0_seq5:30-1115(-)